MKKLYSVFIFLSMLTAAASNLCYAITKNEATEQMITCIMNNNLNGVRRMVNMGADINNIDAKGSMPLLTAIVMGDNDIAELFIEKGAKVNTKNVDGLTPLNTAIKKNMPKIAKLLIEKGADVNATDKTGITPLHNAVLNYQQDITKLLIKKGAKVNAVEYTSGNTPLISAMQAGFLNTEVIETLINAGTKVDLKNDEGISAVDYAAEYATDDNFKAVKLLENSGGKINVHNPIVINGMMRAVYEDNVEFARNLINKGFDINSKYDKKTPFLLIAAEENDPEMVALFIDAGADVDEQIASVGTAMCAAIIGNERGEYTPLFRANSMEIVQLLIRAGADVNLGSSKNFTPLYWASAYSSYNPEMVQLLLQAGADINDADVDGRPLIDLVRTSDKNKTNMSEYSQILKMLKNPKKYKNN